ERLPELRQKQFLAATEPEAVARGDPRYDQFSFRLRYRRRRVASHRGERLYMLHGRSESRQGSWSRRGKRTVRDAMDHERLRAGAMAILRHVLLHECVPNNGSSGD